MKDTNEGQESERLTGGGGRNTGGKQRGSEAAYTTDPGLAHKRNPKFVKSPCDSSPGRTAAHCEANRMGRTTAHYRAAPHAARQIRLSRRPVPCRCRPRDGRPLHDRVPASGRRRRLDGAGSSGRPLRDARGRVVPPDIESRTPGRLPAPPTPPRSRTGYGPARRKRGQGRPEASRLSGNGVVRGRHQTRVPCRRESDQRPPQRGPRGNWNNPRTRTVRGPGPRSNRVAPRWSREQHRPSGRQAKRSAARRPPRGAGSPGPGGRESDFDWKRALRPQGCQLQSIHSPEEDESP